MDPAPALGLALTAYYAYKSRPQKTDPTNYLLYAAFMLIVAAINQALTRTTLTALVPIIEETYKITAARLTPAKNKYVLSGVVFGTIEMLTYITTIPTQEMFLARASIIYIHPTSMLIYSKLKNKLNTPAAFFAATTYHGLWNLLTTTHPWKTPEITTAYITLSTLLAILTLGKEEKMNRTHNTVATLLLFLTFTATTYLSAQHPITGGPTDTNWVMNITIINPTGTYRAIIYNTVKNGTTTHIETIWTDNTTSIYTITITKTPTTPITTALTEVTPTTISTTTTEITRTATVNVIIPTTSNTPVKMTTKIVAFDWHSIIIWASIVSGNTTTIGYTTFYY